jgi:D-3-phosphoglycerate dehydrogenase / 2-oxoglutarate reductase
MTRILVCDNIASEGLELLRQGGDVVVRPGLSEAELIAEVGAYAAIVVRSATQITASVIEAASSCKVIARAGVGIDNIDVPAATRRGILVVNSPAGNILAAAEHAVALMLSAARAIPQASASTKAGGWDRKTFVGRQIQGKTLGLVGLGHVGGEVARRALAMGMRVVAFDPYVTPERAEAVGAELVPFDYLLSQSDFVSLHTVATDETQGLIGERELGLMKPDAILVNTARGSLVDEAALIAALKAGEIEAAALDVFVEEPTGNSELLALPNVIATPHVGAMTHEAQLNVALDAARQVVDVLAGRPARWPVNAPPLPPEAMQAVAPYLPLAQALGQLGRALSQGALQRVELAYAAGLPAQYVGYVMATALAQMLTGAADETINAINAPLLARERGLEVAQTLREDDRGYSNLLELRLHSDEQTTVRGALLDRGRQRIVGIDGYDLDLPPEGFALLIWRTAPSRPGFIGNVGTLLGQAGVNISAIQVSSEAVDEIGLMALTVESLVPDAVLAQIGELDGVVRTTVIGF